MKTLELNQMEELQGDGWLTGLTCGFGIAISAGILLGTAGASAPLVAAAAPMIGAACGLSIGIEYF